jgi:hypothetical protein
MIREILRRDFLGKETDILYACLADFAQNILNIVIFRKAVGSDINLPIRSILYASRIRSDYSYRAIRVLP